MRLFKRARRPSVPAGERVYAIGDIHGRYDLLIQLIERISDEQAALPPARTSLVLLGDMIDRGPQSQRVLELAYRGTLNKRSAVVLLGNHEDAMIESWRGNHDALDGWLEHGGITTLESFGVERDVIDRARPDELVALIRDTIPAHVVEWLQGCPLFHQSGDYLFVHAGIRPGLALAKQDAADMLWIREEFLNYSGDHGVVVVHGHTISQEVDFKANRIGIDTGAYRSGRLSALCLWGSERRVISASIAP